MKPIKLYSTMSRSLELLEPLEPPEVKLYTCGLTVYSHPQIGNWTAYIYWDLLHRTLDANGYRVNRVQNITDVGHLVSDSDEGEDKMQRGAAAEGLDAWQVADKYIAIADKEAQELNLLSPTNLVRATALIEQQQQMVDDLSKAGYTYETDDGIYFDSSRLDDYGKLARLDIDGLEAGARVSDSGKKNPTDFAIWKFSLDKKRDMQWEYPKASGRMGFPGWHLECSVIAQEALGETLDIHTGGIDHIPIHHTNEIAQSESLSHKPLANIWMHNNHLKVKGDKLSKSKGNSFTLEDIQERGYSPMAFKLMVLESHYRTEGNFAWEIISAAQNRLDHWQAVLSSVVYPKPSILQSVSSDEVSSSVSSAREYLRHDLDAPKAIASVDRAIDIIESQISRGEQPAADIAMTAHFLRRDLGLELSLKQVDLEALVTIDGLELTLAEAIDSRARAKESRDYATADTIRAQLEAQGFSLKDNPGSTTITPVRPQRTFPSLS